MNTLLCPLQKRFIADTGPEPALEHCAKENCAWWNPDGEGCAIFALGKLFDVLIKLVKEEQKKGDE